MTGRRRDEAEVQDSSRETAMVTMLGLTRTGGRIGDDATDEYGHSFELKSTTTGAVGTSRDVGHDYLDRMLRRTLVVLKGRSTVLGYNLEALVVVFPRDIAPWVEELRSQIADDENIAQRAIELAGSGLSNSERERLTYLGRRGATRNNPKVPWRYIMSAGVMLRPDRAAEDLALIVDAYDHGASLRELRALVGDERYVEDLEVVAEEVEAE